MGTTPPFRRPGIPFPRHVDIDTMPRVDSISPATARTTGGTAFTIRGHNFDPAATVDFGGFAATSVVVVDSTTITGLTPTVVDPALVDVTVTQGFGGDPQVVTLFGAFTFFESVILRVTPGYGPISGGTAVLIEGYNFLPGTAVYFDASLATDVVVVDSQNITCTTPNHAQGFVDVSLVEPA